MPTEPQSSAERLRTLEMTASFVDDFVLSLWSPPGGAKRNGLFCVSWSAPHALDRDMRGSGAIAGGELFHPEAQVAMPLSLRAAQSGDPPRRPRRESGCS